MYKLLNCFGCVFQRILEEHMNDSEKMAATGQPILVWTKATKVSLYITKTCLCNIQRFLKQNFQQKNFDIIFAQNIDCGYTLEPPRRGGSNEYPQSMFWSKNKKNRYTPAYPSFAIYKWGLRGYILHKHLIMMMNI